MTIERVSLTGAMILHAIRQHMRRHYITRKALVARTGIPERTMDHIMAGRSPLKVDVMMQILDAMDVDAVTFIARVRMEEQQRLRKEKEQQEGKKYAVHQEHQ